MEENVTGKTGYGRVPTRFSFENICEKKDINHQGGGNTNESNATQT